MNSIDALLGNQAPDVVRQLGQQFGLSETQASSALGALLPALAAGVQRNAAQPSGLEGLLGAFTGAGMARYVDDPQALGRQETVEEGNGILGQIFGNKEVSRQVAQRAAPQAGVGPDLLKQMLPIVATLVMGALAKRQAGGGAFSSGGSPGAGVTGGGGLFDLLAPMLDRDRDGSILDDVIGMLGKRER